MCMSNWVLKTDFVKFSCGTTGMLTGILSECLVVSRQNRYLIEGVKWPLIYLELKQGGGSRFLVVVSLSLALSIYLYISIYIYIYIMLLKNPQYSDTKIGS